MADGTWFILTPESEEAVAIVEDIRNSQHVVPMELGSATANVIRLTFTEGHCHSDRILSFGCDPQCEIVCDEAGPGLKSD